MFWEGMGLSKEALQNSDKIYCTNYKGVPVIEPCVFNGNSLKEINIPIKNN
jgi:hypothetical protein